MTIFPVIILKNFIFTPELQVNNFRHKLKKIEEREFSVEIIKPKFEATLANIKPDLIPEAPLKTTQVSCEINGTTVKIQEIGNSLCILENLPIILRERLIGVSNKIIDELGYELVLIKCLKSAQKK